MVGIRFLVNKGSNEFTRKPLDGLILHNEIRIFDDTGSETVTVCPVILRKINGIADRHAYTGFLGQRIRFRRFRFNDKRHGRRRPNFHGIIVHIINPQHIVGFQCNRTGISELIIIGKRDDGIGLVFRGHVGYANIHADKRGAVAGLGQIEAVFDKNRDGILSGIGE